MKRILLCLVVLWVGGLFLTQTPVAHDSLSAASHQGSIGGILVALALCTPIIGGFLLLRLFNQWRRSFHLRMQAEGIVRPRPGVRS